MGATNDASLTPVPLRVDPVTGRLLITVTTGTSGSTAPTRLTVDDNSRDVASAVTDDDAEQRPLATTTEGYLLVDIAS